MVQFRRDYCGRIGGPGAKTAPLGRSWGIPLTFDFSDIWARRPRCARRRCTLGFPLPTCERSPDACSATAEAPGQGRSARAPSVARAEAHATRACRSGAGVGRLYRRSRGRPPAASRAGADRSVRAHGAIPPAAPQRPADLRPGRALGRAGGPPPAGRRRVEAVDGAVRAKKGAPLGPPARQARGRGARAPHRRAAARGRAGVREPPAGRRSGHAGGGDARGSLLPRHADATARVPRCVTRHDHGGGLRGLLAQPDRLLGYRPRDAGDADRAAVARRSRSGRNANGAVLSDGAVRFLAEPPSSLELDDVLRRRALLALDDVELNALAFGQRLESVRLDRGVVNEAVLLAVLGGDETESLRVVEPLHDTGDACHLLYS